MTDDEATPPPIPPYRPGPGAQVPQDAVRGDELSTRERERALESLEARAGFRSHLTVYLLVMLLLSGIWAATTGLGGFFWPIFPMMGWGLGVAIHGTSLMWDRAPTEDEIEAEIQRQRRRARGRLE